MISSKKRLQLIDLFQGSSILRFYQEFLSTLNFSREEIKNYQKYKLISLLNYSSKNVPYYHKLFGRDLDINSNNVFDILKQLPILNRELLQSNNDELISVKYDKSTLNKSSSSGTTGIPVNYYYSKESLSAGVAAGYLAYFLSGWQPGDKSLHIWGNPHSVAHWTKITSKLKRILKNQTNIASTDFNDVANHQRLYNEISEKRFDSVDGYTTAIYELANYISNNNLSPLSAKYVFTTAENLFETQKEIIEKNIGPVSDLYGCGEVNGIAIQPVGEDKYFIIDPHVYVEVEDKSNNFKRIIVTDLDNVAMPLIRYQVGDLIDDVYEPEEEQKVLYSYFKKVLGRDSDIIELPNGKKILPVNIVGGTLFRKIGGISKHKVVWNGQELIFYFETSGDFNKETANRLINNEFKEYNDSIKIKIVEKLLPGKDGKYKYFEKVN